MTTYQFGPFEWKLLGFVAFAFAVFTVFAIAIYKLWRAGKK